MLNFRTLVDLFLLFSSSKQLTKRMENKNVYLFAPFLLYFISYLMERENCFLFYIHMKNCYISIKQNTQRAKDEKGRENLINCIITCFNCLTMFKVYNRISDNVKRIITVI